MGCDTRQVRWQEIKRRYTTQVKASASSVDLTDLGNIVNITGTTLIDTITDSVGGLKSGDWLILHFSSAGVVLGTGGNIVVSGPSSGQKFLSQAGQALHLVYNAAGDSKWRRAGENPIFVGSGWTAMTGTADKATSWDTTSITLEQLAQRVKALQDNLAINTRPNA